VEVVTMIHGYGTEQLVQQRMAERRMEAATFRGRRTRRLPKATVGWLRPWHRPAVARCVPGIIEV
jgi:hypothetical protein